MTFGAIPYYEREAKTAISARLQVRGIPSLMIFGPVPKGGGDRPLINGNVRACIEGGNAVAEFPFLPKRYGNLNRTSEDINSKKCVIVFHENGDDEEQEEVQQAVTEAAGKCDDKTLLFFWALEPEGLAKAVREAVKLGPIKDEPLMVMLDIGMQGSYWVSDAKDITADAILSFVDNPGDRKIL